MTKRIININENFGDAVEFDSVEEMIAAINETECLENVSSLIEGEDYEFVK